MTSKTHQIVLLIGNTKYTTDITLYENDDICIKMEENTLKNVNSVTFDAKTVLKLTTEQFKIVLNSPQFYNIIVASTKKDKDIVLTLSNDDDAIGQNVNWNIKWKISEFVEKEVNFTIGKIVVSDDVRIGKMVADVLKCKEEIVNHNKTTELLKHDILKLQQAVNSLTKFNSNVVQTTIITKKERTLYVVGKNIIEFEIYKKHPTSMLYVSANLCVYGENNANTCQIWTLTCKDHPQWCTNKDRKIVTTGQSEGHTNNSGYARQLICSTVFDKLEKAGVYHVSLSFEKPFIPFNVLNPNKTEHSQFGENQTQSFIKVEEIMVHLPEVNSSTFKESETIYVIPINQ